MAQAHGGIFRTRYLQQIKPFPHGADLAEVLHAKGLPVILASSAERAEVEYYVELLKIGANLAGTVSKDDVQKFKTCRRYFRSRYGQGISLGRF